MDHRFAAGRSTSCQRRAIFFSSLQGCTRHALPSPANDQCHHQPYQLLHSGRILAKFAEHSIGRPILSVVWLIDWNLVVLKNRLFKTLLSAAPRPIQL
jgi:hypothetical protein